MDTPSDRGSRWPFACLAFVVYGSPVPLHYTPMPWGHEVERCVFR